MVANLQGPDGGRIGAAGALLAPAGMVPSTATATATVSETRDCSPHPRGWPPQGGEGPGRGELLPARVGLGPVSFGLVVLDRGPAAVGDWWLSLFRVRDRARVWAVDGSDAECRSR